MASFQKTIFEEGGTHVHLAYEEALESQSLIRKDFRETWLFDIILLNERYFNLILLLKIIYF